MGLAAEQASQKILATVQRETESLSAQCYREVLEEIISELEIRLDAAKGDASLDDDDDEDL